MPTRRQSLISAALDAIRDLSGAINTACQHEYYTDDQFAANVKKNSHLEGIIQFRIFQKRKNNQLKSKNQEPIP